MHDNLDEEAQSTASQWLTVDSIDRVESLLHRCGVSTVDERVLDVGRAGEGNMNLTLRVRTSQQTVIVKQSRPWVEKYPQIAAPVERILQELRFYQTVAEHPAVAQRMPKWLGSCPEQYVIVLECLDDARDASGLYQQEGSLSQFEALLPELLAWLTRLHAIEIPSDRLAEFANGELRSLNHQHIFVIPFAAQPALDLDEVTPGLANVARPLTTNEPLLGKLTVLGELYLADHLRLVHGDFFPGSWMLGERGVHVIDPEFSHGGQPEFDLGVLLAHGKLLATGEPENLLIRLQELYTLPSHATEWRLVEDFAAVEVLRRLLGVAQLPIELTLEEKTKLVEHAVAQLVA